MLPVVDHAPLHLARVPPAPHQQRRSLRVRPLAPVTPVPLHPHLGTPAQEPRPPGVAPPLTGLSVPAVRTPPPLPDFPLRQRPQPLEKRSPALYEVHALWIPGMK